jgi:flagellin-like hook-associated protein FlgL
MRVADSTSFGNIIFYLQRAQVRQAQLQQQLSSGLRISSPSDDPIGFGKVVDYQTLQAAIDQRQRGVSTASSQLTQADSSLQTATGTLLPQAEELAVAMANSTNGPTERLAAAEELKGLIGQMLEVANQKVGDRSIFTGSTTRGRVTGTTIATPSAGAPVTITAGTNDTLAVNVDGVSSGTVTLTAGTYASGDALAAEVQTRINADPTLTAAGKSVKASFQTNHLVITSDSYGASSTVTVISGLARGSIGLAGGTVSNGANPFSLAVQTSAGSRNTGGAVVTPGQVTNASDLTSNDYLVKFTSPTAYKLYSVNSPVTGIGTATNTGGGIVTQSVVNDPSQLTLDNYQAQFKNIYTVSTGANDGIRFDPGSGPVTATLAAGSYTGAQLAAQIKSAMEAVSGGKTYTVSFDETAGKFSVTNDSGNAASLSLLFSNPASSATALAGFNPLDKTGIPAGSVATSDVDTTGAAGVTKQSDVFDTTAGTNIFNITTANNTLIVNDTAGGAGADTTITLTPGSYTGAQIATELASQLNASRNLANATAYTVSYGSVTARRFTINDPAGNANSLILKFGATASTAAQILGSTPITATETVGGGATTLNSDAGNTLYQSGGSIDFDGLRVSIKDGGTAVRNGDVFTVSQTPTLISSNLYTSAASIGFDGIKFSLTGTGGSAPATGDVYRVINTYAYNGDAVDGAVQIGDNVSTATVLNGDKVFVGSNGGTDVFSALQSLTRALLSNNVDAIQAAQTDVTTATNQVLNAQGAVGARENRLQGVTDGLTQSKTDVQTLLSGVEDTDFTKAASELSFQQLALQAAALSASHVLQTSLLNFLK